MSNQNILKCPYCKNRPNLIYQSYHPTNPLLKVAWVEYYRCGMRGSIMPITDENSCEENAIKVWNNLVKKILGYDSLFRSLNKYINTKKVD